MIRYALVAVVILAGVFKWQAMSCDTELTELRGNVATSNEATKTHAAVAETVVTKSEVAARKKQTEFARKRVEGHGPESMNEFFKGL